jgi:hypothetical protein
MSERLWCHLAIDPKQLELCNELGALLVGDALPVRQEPVEYGFTLTRESAAGVRSPNGGLSGVQGAASRARPGSERAQP